MRLVIKVISVLCFCFCLAVFALTLFGFLTLPDSVVAGKTPDAVQNAIFRVQSVSSDGQARTQSTESGEEQNAYYSLLGIFPVKKVSVKQTERDYVYPSGQTFGLKLYSDGVLIVGIDDVVLPEGEAGPAKKAGLQIGDIIKLINGKSVFTNSDVSRLLADSAGEEVRLTVIRNGAEKEVIMKPVRSDGSTLKAGMWIRDSFAGIGTMTFYTDENYFGGLGHAVTDIDTGETVPIVKGEAVATVISGCVRGTEHNAGELYGIFSQTKLGDLSVNSDRGVFGRLSSAPSQNRKVPVALRREIKTGKAQIISTVDENGPQYYEIEITKLFANSENSTKNMEIKVTDENLINKTGGIVQGMSGSPIIQDGKLVGAVTHVFVNNPTGGYAIYAEKMLEEIKTVKEQYKTAA